VLSIPNEVVRERGEVEDSVDLKTKRCSKTETRIKKGRVKRTSLCSSDRGEEGDPIAELAALPLYKNKEKFKSDLTREGERGKTSNKEKRRDKK
jgi:hypothetical protein